MHNTNFQTALDAANVQAGQLTWAVLIALAVGALLWCSFGLRLLIDNRPKMSRFPLPRLPLPLTHSLRVKRAQIANAQAQPLIRNYFRRANKTSKPRSFQSSAAI